MGLGGFVGEQKKKKWDGFKDIVIGNVLASVC